jgi:hypothetical protein
MLGLLTFLPMDYQPTQELHTYLWAPSLLTLSTYLGRSTFVAIYPWVMYLSTYGLLTYLLRLGAIKNIYGRLHRTILNATYGLFRMLHRSHLKEYKGTSQVWGT